MSKRPLLTRSTIRKERARQKELEDLAEKETTEIKQRHLDTLGESYFEDSTGFDENTLDYSESTYDDPDQTKSKESMHSSSFSRVREKEEMRARGHTLKVAIFFVLILLGILIYLIFNW